MEIEIKRKIVHSLGVFTILLIQIFGKWYGALIMLLISTAFFMLGEYRKNKHKFDHLKTKALNELEDLLEDEVKTVERPKELPFKGAITFYFGCFLTTILFQPHIAIASITVLALADSLSTLIGYFYGKHKLPINKSKSWEGSLTFLIISFSVLLLFINPFKALTAGILTTLVEMLPKVDDNIFVPLSVGLFMILIS